DVYIRTSKAALAISGRTLVLVLDGSDPVTYNFTDFKTSAKIGDITINYDENRGSLYITIVIENEPVRIRRDDNGPVLISMKTSSQFAGKTEGGCGNLNSNCGQGLKTCKPEDLKSANAACAPLYDFKSCHDAVPVESYLGTCLQVFCTDLYETNLTAAMESVCSSFEQYQTECVIATKKMYPWRNATLCPPKCSPDKVFNALIENKCQPTCGILPESSNNKGCNVEPYGGCVCAQGYSLDRGNCVRREECPCRASDNKYYNASQKFNVPGTCDVCTCDVGGQWKCNETLPTCYGSCSVYAGRFIMPFDYNVYKINNPCGRLTLVEYGNITVTLETTTTSDRKSTINTLRINVDGTETTIQTTLAGATTQNALTPRIVAGQITNNYYFVDVDGGTLRIYITREGLYYIRVDTSIFAKKVTGACGDFDGVKENDFMNKDNSGVSGQEFIAIQGACPTAEYQDVSTL
ncbi:unnamed protein product, partial [Candidula unifasciata]